MKDKRFGMKLESNMAVLECGYPLPEGERGRWTPSKFLCLYSCKLMGSTNVKMLLFSFECFIGSFQLYKSKF